MTPERLTLLKERVASRLEHATGILDGGENYDGADGAREVEELCEICNELIQELENRLQP